MLLLQVVLPVLAALTITFWAGLLTAERLVEQRMKEDVELVARSIRLPVSYSLRHDEPVSLYNALSSVFDIGRVYGAAVYDLDGEKLASVGSDYPGAQTPAEVAERLRQDGDGSGLFEQVNGQALYSYTVPLTEPAGQQAGLLHVTRRFSDFTDDLAGLRRNAGAALGLVVTFIVGLILLGHRAAIGRPLQNLFRTMARVRDGALQERVRAGGPREIASLGSTLNDMLDSLQQAQQELVERARLQRQLTEQLRDSERLAAIGRLSAGIAHEIGTPLSVIDGKARRLERRGDDNDLRDLRTIRQEVQRMGQIVRQLLDFGHGRATPYRDVAIAQVCHSAVGGLRELAAREGVQIDYQPAGEKLVIRGDALRLEQAVTNLLRNAIQAAPEGRVRFAAECDGDMLCLRVEDSGDGVDAPQRRRIFDPFFTTKPVGRGTGLGLSVAHGVAEEHGGDLQLCEQGTLGGACFALRLPLQGAEADGYPPTEEAPHA